MAQTIIQTIGPLYGEVINGTVFGRPNGSVYVPSVNTITATIPTGYDKVRITQFAYGYRYTLCNSAGELRAASFVAESQDIQSYIQVEVQDEDGIVLGSARSFSAGIFNLTSNILGNAGADGTPAIVEGTTYYLVASLMSASGVPVATSKVVLTGVEPE